MSHARVTKIHIAQANSIIVSRGRYRARNDNLLLQSSNTETKHNAFKRKMFANVCSLLHGTVGTHVGTETKKEIIIESLYREIVL